MKNEVNGHGQNECQRWMISVMSDAGLIYRSTPKIKVAYNAVQ